MNGLLYGFYVKGYRYVYGRRGIKKIRDDIKDIKNIIAVIVWGE